MLQNALTGYTLPFLLVVLALAGRPADAQILGDLERSDRFGSAFATGDFNGDGFPDLAVGTWEGGGTDANGAVNVLYGTASGLTAAGNQFWSQDSPGIADQGESLDFFSWSLASGDFDGDGYSDLAVGVPQEDLEQTHPGQVRRDVGALHVLYGSATGLTASGSRFGHRDSPGVLGTAGLGDEFGRALASGDFDGDGYDDLAVGAPGDWAGSVTVFYGSASGLRVAGDQVWTQDSAGIEDEAERGESFGDALAAGDFDGDGRDDLAIGVYAEAVSGVARAGAVNVLYGSAAGLSADRNQFWHQDSPGVLDLAEFVDLFGWSLASGDFDGDGRDDLAVGVQQEDVFGISNAGAVNVLYGSAAGLTEAGNQYWHQDSPGVEDEAETSDLFGYALTSGDFDGDGFSDLAVGVRQEAFGSIGSAGAANVLYGSATGLNAIGNQFWFQELDGLPDLLEFRDHFGSALGVGDFDGDGLSDLAIGVPEEGIGAVNDAGAVNVLYGTGGGGLSAVGNQFWYQGATAPPRHSGGVSPLASVATLAETTSAGAAVAVPNPAGDRVALAFVLAAPEEVRLALYDVLGREVAAVDVGRRAAGAHAVALDVSALPAGVYVWRVVAGARVEGGQLTVAR